MTISNFQNIPMFPRAYYEVFVHFASVLREIENYIQNDGLDLDPDFQRGHVWTREQQIAYVEYRLRGGESGDIILMNCPGWPSVQDGVRLELVDGKQRLEAVMSFLRDEIPAFGTYRKDFQGVLRLTHGGFRIRICSLETRREVLELYLAHNAGGTPHSPEEIERVRGLLKKETI